MTKVTDAFRDYGNAPKNKNGKDASTLAIEAYRRVEAWLHSLLTSAFDRDEWSASRPGRFTPGKEPRYPFNRRLGGPHSLSGHYAVIRTIKLHVCVRALIAHSSNYCWICFVPSEPSTGTVLINVPMELITLRVIC